MARTIAFAHYKGGTGKTTSCINVAGFLQKLGHKVLVVDLDPQGNLTSGLGIDKSSLDYSAYHVMENQADIRQAILRTLTPGIHIVPANLDLSKAAIMEYTTKEDILILKNSLETVKDYYDFILIDTPPLNGHFIINGIAASDLVVLVLDQGIFALDGVESFKSVLDEYGKKTKFNFNIGVALVNKCKNSIFDIFSKDYGKDIADGAKEMLGKDVFMMPYSYDVVESQIKGIPISHYKPYSSIGRAYNNVTNELLKLSEKETR